jgi:hypothetical protein
MELQRQTEIEIVALTVERILTVRTDYADIVHWCILVVVMVTRVTVADGGCGSYSRSKYALSALPDRCAVTRRSALATRPVMSVEMLQFL